MASSCVRRCSKTEPPSEAYSLTALLAAQPHLKRGLQMATHCPAPTLPKKKYTNSNFSTTIAASTLVRHESLLLAVASSLRICDPSALCSRHCSKYSASVFYRGSKLLARPRTSNATCRLVALALEMTSDFQACSAPPFPSPLRAQAAGNSMHVVSHFA